MIPIKFLNTQQAAGRFGLSTSYLEKLRVNGGGPVHFKVGRRVLYREDEFQAWIEDHRRNNTSEG